ncbi:hypothetical protein F01_440151 [Burkholderia cenocepacia]|nr:hypothetical protein F01_440151 [Burkholderia cenocepacia]
MCTTTGSRRRPSRRATRTDRRAGSPPGDGGEATAGATGLRPRPKGHDDGRGERAFF